MNSEPFTPDDKQRIAQAFEALSTDSRYKRFMAYFKHLSPTMLNYLTEVDQINHVAWAATLIQEDGEIGLGVARFIRLSEMADTAEVAIAVIDRYQSKGIGNILFAVIYHMARFYKVRSFVGNVIPQNAYVLQKLRDMHAKIHYDGYAYEFEIPICEDLELCIQSESMERFKTMFDQIGAKLFKN